MSATLVEPVIHEPVSLEPQPPVIAPAKIQPKADTNPLVIIFVACFVALNLSVVLIGPVVAWIYFLRDSGAFAP